MLVIGAGGLGSATVPYLAGAGIGTIGIIDNDVVELSNLHRQVAHKTSGIGSRKVASLATAATEINPNVQIITHDLHLNSSNGMQIFGEYDLVIDGSDNFPTRYLANDAAQLSEIPLVLGCNFGPSRAGQCCMAQIQAPDIAISFPNPPAPDKIITCETGGVLPGLYGTIGSLLVTEAMKLITGIGEPLIGRVLVYDALAAKTGRLAIWQTQKLRL